MNKNVRFHTDEKPQKSGQTWKKNWNGKNFLLMTFFLTASSRVQFPIAPNSSPDLCDKSELLSLASTLIQPSRRPNSGT